MVTSKKRDLLHATSGTSTGTRAPAAGERNYRSQVNRGVIGAGQPWQQTQHQKNKELQRRNATMIPQHEHDIPFSDLDPRITAKIHTGLDVGEDRDTGITGRGGIVRSEIGGTRDYSGKNEFGGLAEDMTKEEQEEWNSRFVVDRGINEHNFSNLTSERHKATNRNFQLD